MTIDFEKPDSAIIRDGLATPLVSVVIPVYNVCRYVSQCMDSILCQSYGNMEIMVIDDGSTDGSGRICDEYARRDPRVFVVHTENRGLASARNLGLEKASGTFLSFVDSDDWVEPVFIERLVRTAMETEADIVCVNSCSEFVGKTVCPQIADDQRCFRGQNILQAFATGSFRSVIWNKLYRRSCFSGIHFPDGHNYEDISTTWKLMQKLVESDALVVELPATLYHFRNRKSSISRTQSCSNIIDYWLANLKIYEGLAEYQDRLLPACFSGIGRMWLHYSAFSKEEKTMAEPTIREMQAFSKKHFQEAMRGKYSKLIKIACLLSRWRNADLMWLCSCGGKLRRLLKNKESIMFE